MPEVKNPKYKEYEERLRPRYGEYLTTFVSENGEVIIDFFEDPRRGFTAWIRFKEGMKYDDVTDKWVKEMHEIARRYGRDNFWKCFDAMGTQ